ncbi:2-C-methyl-D-erythritol 4-phosphate cytidylyltransferase [Rhodoluna lacicola]|uniref:Bifunctional enzyme IspD/IspF n=1 Tax=Rhodoluna lacicola TaxID=529884 RepID=A0A060JLU1_9MICO|nr:2-C-methyl-D-erythritol 4-phosphate cytidylyltransferase [Rhodoluna lacicola]AIC47194.1 2-C-methyl-D-erythritol 2,4-cyclodiphosphate synthase/2-C-methyl-D-erythritol 4-phosphate cytidylyltransferase [Rhodoluna lacicola]
MTSRDLAVVVVAAGLGTRLGADKPKAFVTLAEKTLIEHALENVAEVPALEQVIVAVPAGHEAQTVEIIELALAGKNVRFDVVVGGQTRQQSIANALGVIDPEIEVVLVHDAARALAPASLFTRVASEVRRTGLGVVPVMKIADTVKRVDANVVRETVDREALRVAQTPQGFVAKELLKAYAATTAEHTDDASLVQAHGMQVNAIEGDERAFKITTADDLTAAELRFVAADSDGSLRTGIGTDVHRFTADAEKPLYLGTVIWPGERGLDGHSDGDAVSHAIVDALLSAAGLGDIGANFGVDRPEFAGANGRVFIEATLKLLQQKGFSVRNVAVQIIGNRPKVAPMRAEVEKVLTDIIGSPVTLGATTTDGLGFLGNAEGVAAVATALIAHTNSGPTTAPKVG